MRLRLAVPDSAITPEMLNHALEFTTLANQQLLAQGKAPLATDLLRRGNKWKPERYGDGEHFDLLPTIGERGWGDCDDWAPGLAAELRHTGQDPGARATIRRTGASRWHALVETSDGRVLDPSLWAGMPSRRAPTANPKFAKGVAGAFWMPRGKGWSARCDLPTAEGHIVGIAHGAPSPQHALVQASYGVCAAHPWGDFVMEQNAAVVGEMSNGGRAGRVTYSERGPLVVRV